MSSSTYHCSFCGHKVAAVRHLVATFTDRVPTTRRLVCPDCNQLVEKFLRYMPTEGMRLLMQQLFVNREPQPPTTQQVMKQDQELMRSCGVQWNR